MIIYRKRASSILLMTGAALNIHYIQAASQKKIATKVTQNTHQEQSLNKHFIDDKKGSLRKSDSSRQLTITNNIQDAQLAYTYCFMSYKPTSFSVQVNGKIIDQAKSERISITDNKIRVRYDYAFLNGKRKGAKEIEFEIDPQASNLALQFSWDKESRIVIDNAKPTAISKIY